MIKGFILIISILTNDGTLQMRAIDVPSCPTAENFSAGMDQLQKDGRLKDWNAICIPRDQRGA